MSLENTFRDIIAAKGYRMSDIAAKMGVTQSNLVASLRKNPKLSTILYLAEAVGCSVTDLLQPASTNSSALGLAVIDGVTYKMTRADSYLVQLPVYTDHQELRSAIRKFVTKNTKNESGNDVLCGMVDSIEFFTLFFDATNAVYHLALCYAAQQTMTIDYDLLEFGEPLDVESLLEQMITDIENAVVTKLTSESRQVTNYYTNLIKKDTLLDVDNESSPSV